MIVTVPRHEGGQRQVHGTGYGASLVFEAPPQTVTYVDGTDLYVCYAATASDALTDSAWLVTKEEYTAGTLTRRTIAGGSHAFDDLATDLATVKALF